MRKSWIKFLTVLTVLCIAFGATACASPAKRAAQGFSLSQTEITVYTDDQPTQLKVMKDNAAYRGTVRWVSEDPMVVSAYQGYVKGVGTGSSVVRAEIAVGSETVTLSCKVSVKQSVTAEIYDVTAFSGLGDVDITLASGLYTSGATATVQSVKKADGTAVDALKQSSGRYYLTNDATSPLAAGRYAVTYRISAGEVSKEFERNVHIKPADRYENIFVLDAVDGTEEMLGMAANLEYLTYLQRNDENPGEYVTYTENGNTGYTAENGIDQTRAEMLQSLRDEGYDGFLNENYAGYDTVYRMYCKKDNTTRQPLPFFYLNLRDTANPLWINLDADSLPENVYLNVWMRVWHRTDSSEPYTLLPPSNEWGYLYKSMNDGETEIGGVGPIYSGGTWAHCKFDLSAIAVQAQGANHIAIGFGVWGDESDNFRQGEFLFELYSVELDIPNTLSTVTGDSLDLKLYGEYSGIFDSYTFVVKDGADRVALEGNQDSTVVALTEDGNGGLMRGGSYTVEYTLEKGGVPLTNKYVRKLKGA